MVENNHVAEYFKSFDMIIWGEESQTWPKFKIPIEIYSLIKAAYCCQKSSPSYQFNSLNFDVKISSVRSPWDHLKCPY